MKTSVVITSRNDNYGGHLNERATYCLNSMCDTFDEVWYVDWNSPSDKSSLLYDIKNDIKTNNRLNHIVVNPQVAGLLTNNDPNAQKCCEVLGRNLGIKRATGDWIVSSNIDIIAPKKEDLNQLLSTIDKNTFYTLSRRHINRKEFENYSYDKFTELRNHLYKTTEPREHTEKVVEGDDYSIINCCGDFQIAHRDLWCDIKGFEERLIYCLYTDTNVQKKAAMHGYGLKAIFEPPIFHIHHGTKGYGGGNFGGIEGGEAVDGMNRVTNNPQDAIVTQYKTQNLDSWGFSDLEVEYETL
tara:strand:- start:851 stop:1744 length:894 start_codon:yes stop_codon:yes gene_type:complete